MKAFFPSVILFFLGICFQPFKGLICITKSSPSIKNEEAELSWYFELSNLSQPKDQLQIQLLEEISSLLTSTSARAILYSNTNEEETVSATITESESRKIITLTLPKNISKGIIIAEGDDGYLGFKNPNQFNSSFQIVCKYNLNEVYNDEWTPTEEESRLNFLKGGPYNTLPFSETELFFRFSANRALFNTSILFYLHPEFILASFDCTLSFNFSNEWESVDGVCSLEEDSEKFLKYILIKFSAVESIFDYYFFRENTVFQVNISLIKNSWNFGRFLFPIEWLDEEKNILDEINTYTMLYPKYFSQAYLKNIDQRLHSQLVSLVLFISLSDFFNAGDKILIEFIDFEFDPEEEKISTEFEIQTNSTLTTIPFIQTNQTESQAIIYNLPEDTNYFELHANYIKTPANNAIFQIKASFYSLEDLMESKIIEVPVQFSKFELLPFSTEIGLLNQTYTFLFQFLQNIEPDWSLKIKLPFEVTISSNPPICTFQGLNCECSIEENTTPNYLILVPITTSILSGDEVSFTITGIDNPEKVGSFEYFIFFLDETKNKKAQFISMLTFICPSQYIYSDYFNDCIHCLYPCSECSRKPSICLTCDSNAFWLDKTLCVSECPQDTYPYESKCVPCPPHCINCSLNAESDIKCFSCTHKYFLNSEGRCQKCSVSNCNHCNPENSSQCLECASHYLLQDFQCKKCNDNCFQCENDISTCTQCFLGNYLYQSHCYSECPSLTYVSESRDECVDCDYPLKKTNPTVFSSLSGMALYFTTNIQTVRNLETDTKRSQELCEYLFTKISYQKFGNGEGYYCLLRGNLLFVGFSPSFTLSPNDIIYLKDNVIMAIGCPNYFGSDISFQIPSSFTTIYPNAVILSPPIISYLNNLPLKVDSITNYAQKELDKITWEIQYFQGDSSQTIDQINSILSNACQAIKSSSKVNVCKSIIVPGESLMPGTYIFKVTIKNWLGASSTIISNEVEIIESLAPIVDLENTFTFYIEHITSVTLDAKANFEYPQNDTFVAPSISDLNFSWEQISSLEFRNPNLIDFSSNSPSLFIPKNCLLATEDFAPYKFKVTIQYLGIESAPTFIIFEIHVTEASPYCSMTGIGAMKQNQVINITSDRSHHYSFDLTHNFVTTTQIQYQWTCTQSSGEECLYNDGRSVPTVSGFNYHFDPFELPLNSYLTITLACTIGDASSTDTGVIYIEPSQNKIINTFYPNQITAIPGKSLPLGLEINIIQYQSLNCNGPLSFSWSLNNIPSEYGSLNDTMHYYFIGGEGFQDGGLIYEASVVVYSGDCKGKATYSINTNNPPIVNSIYLNYGSSSTTKGFSEMLTISTRKYTSYSDYCLIYYFFYWSLNSTNPEFEFIGISTEAIMTTSKKPCQSLLFKVTAYTCKGIGSSVISNSFSNGINCETPTIKSLFENVDNFIIHDVIEAISAALFILEQDNHIASKSDFEIILQKLDDLNLQNNLPQKELNEIKMFIIKSLRRLWNFVQPLNEDLCDTFLSILESIAQEESFAIIKKGTCAPRYIDLIDLSDFAGLIDVKSAKYSIQILDNLVDFYLNQSILADQKRKTRIMNTLFIYAQSLTKDIYPIANSSGSTISGRNFNFTIYRIFLSELTSSLINYSTFKLEIGSFKANFSTILLNSVYILFLGEFHKSLCNIPFSNPLTKSIFRMAIMTEDTREPTTLSLDTLFSIKVTLQLEKKLMEKEQVKTLDVLSKSIDDIEFSTSYLSNISYTNESAIFSIDILDGITDFTAQLTSHYVKIYKDDENIENHSNLQYSICFIGFMIGIIGLISFI